MRRSESGAPKKAVTTHSSPARLTVLLSGSGRTLVNILDRIAEGSLSATVARVIASRDCLGLSRARERGVPAEIIHGTIPADRLAAILQQDRADFVVLAGYLRMVDIPPGFEHRVVNIHPALLPAFGGPGMHGRHVHRAVLDAGCKVSGCTVHLCDRVYDRGPIILQRACPVLEDDTPETLAARVFEQECLAYPEALQLLIENRVQVVDPRESEHGPWTRARAKILPTDRTSQNRGR